MHLGTWQNECWFYFLIGRYLAHAFPLKQQECPHPPGVLLPFAHVWRTSASTKSWRKAQYSSQHFTVAWALGNRAPVSVFLVLAFVATNHVFSLFMTVLPLQLLSHDFQGQVGATHSECPLPFLLTEHRYPPFLASILTFTLWEFLTPSKKGSETKGNPEYSRKALTDSWRTQT